MNKKIDCSELIKRVFTGSLIGIFFSILYFYFPPIIFSLSLFILLGIIVIFEIPGFIANSMSWLQKGALYLYPFIPMTLLVILNQNPAYRSLIALIFGFTFINDVAAYFVGKYCGSHLMLPSISPKKTWEGFLAGLIALFIAMIIVAHAQGCAYSYMYLRLFLLSLWWAIFATGGDLFESFLKRRARLKDSGSLLPGHGGLLDRFDSIFAVTVGIYLVRETIGSFFCL